MILKTDFKTIVEVGEYAISKKLFRPFIETFYHLKNVEKKYYTKIEKLIDIENKIKIFFKSDSEIKQFIDWISKVKIKSNLFIDD